MALPKYPFYSKGCPVQAPLGRGCSDVTDSRFAGDYGSVMPWGLGPASMNPASFTS